MLIALGYCVSNDVVRQSHHMNNLEKAAAVIAEYAHGERLTDLFSKYDISASRFHHAITSDATIGADYVRAREIRADVLADEVTHIADTDPDPQRAKNRMQARQWITSKLYPRTYGERLDVNVAQTVDISGAISDARRRALRHGRDTEQIEDAQVIERAALTAVRTTDGLSVALDKAAEKMPNPFED